MLKNIVFTLLIFCYSIGVTVGAVAAFNELFHSGNKQHQLASENKSRTAPDKPVWTVKTNAFLILHFEFSNHIYSSNGIFFFDASPKPYEFLNFQSRYTHLECLPSKPRDPPLV